MPITGTGSNVVIQTTTEPLESVGLTSTETANTTSVDKRPLVLKPPMFDIRVKQETDLNFTFRDERGNPCDISSYSPSQFKAYGRECVQGSVLSPMPVTIVDAVKGTMTIRVTKTTSGIPGVFNCVVVCTSPSDAEAIIKDNPFYLYITHSIPTGATFGPPPLWELRLQLRDTSPEENLLFDGLNYADEEIAFAVKKSIMAFNEAPPIEDYPKYSSSNFPFPDLLKEGVIAQLYFTVAEYQRKNNLQYSAGGVSLNDKNKEANFMQLGQTYWQQFLQQAQLKKVNYNIESNWDTVHSAYLPYYW